MTTLKLNNRTRSLYYRVRGKGDNLLLIHGLGGSGADWEFQIRALERYFRVIVPDLPGSGFSSPLDGSCSIAALAEALWTLIDHLKMRNINIAGFSLGGAVALEMALQRPDDVPRLAMINSLATYRIHHWRKWLEARVPPLLIRLLGMKRAAQFTAARLFPKTWQQPLRERAASVMTSASASGQRQHAAPRHHRITFAWATIVVLVTAPVMQALAGAGAIPQRCLKQASTGLDARVADTLQQIHGIDRQLLALRAYLRAGDQLGQRWSWTAQQLADYPGTPEGKAAAADIDTVLTVFARSNPGYTLHVNRMPRSLDEQLAHWNDNDSVRKVAAQLVIALRRQFPDESQPTPDQLKQALIEWKPSIAAPLAAPLAAPGLSAHGQGRAFDFEVQRDGHNVAGLEVSAARRQWDAQGWTRKLHSAVVSSGRPLTGPLQAPYEPWHYAYAPIGHIARP